MLGPEASKAFIRRTANFPYTKGVGIDIGYRGSINADPYPNCIGVELGDPTYDGINLDYESCKFDFLHASHCLEHIPTENLNRVIFEWFRVIKLGGYLICTVPHQHLYEMKANLPSRWNADHKRFYTPSVLAKEFENALLVNSYRIRSLKDCDEGYTYFSPTPNVHAGGEYEIEIIIQKICPPSWKLV